MMTLSSVAREMKDLEYSWAANCSGPLTRSIKSAKCSWNVALSFLPLVNAIDFLCKCLNFFPQCFALDLECFRKFLEQHSCSDEMSLDEMLFSCVLASLSEPVSEDASVELEEGKRLRFLICGPPIPLLDFLHSLSGKEWCRWCLRFSLWCFCFVIRNFILCLRLTLTLLLFEIRAFLTLGFAFTSVSLLELELIVLLLEPALTSMVTTVELPMYSSLYEYDSANLLEFSHWIVSNY